MVVLASVFGREPWSVLDLYFRSGLRPQSWLDQQRELGYGELAGLETALLCLRGLQEAAEWHWEGRWYVELEQPGEPALWLPATITLLDRTEARLRVECAASDILQLLERYAERIRTVVGETERDVELEQREREES